MLRVSAISPIARVACRVPATGTQMDGWAQVIQCLKSCLQVKSQVLGTVAGIQEVHKTSASCLALPSSLPPIRCSKLSERQEDCPLC